MFSLSSLLSSVALPFVDKLIDKGAGIWESYLKKEISKEEMREKMVEVVTGSAKEIDVTHANVLQQTWATFWTAADQDKSNLMKRMWAIALGSQIFVLFWSQFFVPLLYAYGLLPNWKAGTSADWAYLLVGALLGMGPMVLRSGPGAGSITERLKALIGK